MARIGVFVCQCGTNISDRVDISRIMGEAQGLEDVVLVESHRLLCSPDGRSYLEKRIADENLTHVVVAACSPREHQQTFMDVCDRAGLNPYMMSLANIREQCAWITEDMGESTSKAIRLVRAAIGRVTMQVPLESREMDINPDVLVVGGGIAGLQASLTLASPGRTVYLVERSPDLGGRALHFESALDGKDPPAARVEEMMERVAASDHIKVMISAEVESLIGFLGNFEAVVRERGEEKAVELKIGAVILATGADVLDCASIEQLGYGRLEGVVTADELEKMINEGGVRGGDLRSVAFVHCVGRDEVGYCSGICCLYSLRLSRQLRESLPSVDITHIYRDMCVPGKSAEEPYRELVDMGHGFVRASSPQIRRKGGRLELSFVKGAERASMEADMVVLVPALVPARGTDDVARLVNVPTGIGGFLTERHQKLAPVMTARDGIFVAGCAKSPASAADVIIQAKASAGGILATLVPGRKIQPEVKTSYIAEAFCQGCQSCVQVCSYGAISFDERRKVAVVNEIICRGCGNCVAACPSGAASLKHSTYDQIYQEIMEAVR